MEFITEDRFYEIYKERMKLYYDSCYYDSDRDYKFSTHSWGTASAVQTYLVNTFIGHGFTQVMAEKTYSHWSDGRITPPSGYSFITPEKYPELKKLHDEAEEARKKYNVFIWNRWCNYLDRIYYLEPRLKRNLIDAEYVEQVKKFIAYEDRIKELRDGEYLEHCPNGKKYNDKQWELEQEYKREFERTHPGYKEECDEAFRRERERRGTGNYAKIREKYGFVDYVPEATAIERCAQIFYKVLKSSEKKIYEHQKAIGNFENYCRGVDRWLKEQFPDYIDSGRVNYWKSRFGVELTIFHGKNTTPTAASTAAVSAAAPSPSAPKTTMAKPKPQKATPAKPKAEKPKVEEPKAPPVPTQDEVRKYCLLSNGNLRAFTGPMDYVTLPDDVTAIWSSTFKSVKNSLRVVILPDNLDLINVNTFKDCPNLEEVKLPKNLKTICERAFENCPKLKSITFPDGLKLISSYAFIGCESLKSVTLPSDCTYCEAGTPVASFPADCEIIISAKKETSSAPRVIPPVTAELKQRVADCCDISNGELRFCKEAFEVLVLPEGITKISQRAVSMSKHTAREVVLPNSLERIDRDTFKDFSELEVVSLGLNLKSIDVGAFAYCKKLRRVEFHLKMSYIHDQAFSGCSELKEVYIPDGCIYTKDFDPVFDSFPQGCKVHFLKLS